MSDEDEPHPTAGEAGRVVPLLAVVREVVAEARATSAAPAVQLDSHLETELGLDSLGVAELLVRVEERFDCRLPEQVLAEVATPRDLLHELSAAAGTGAGTRSEVEPETSTETGPGTKAGRKVGTKAGRRSEARAGTGAEISRRQRPSPTDPTDPPAGDVPRQPPAHSSDGPRPAFTERVYGGYALLVFAAIAAVTWPVVVLTPGLGRRWRIVRAAGRVLFRATGNRVEFVGVENLPARGPYVVAANHASFLDPLVLSFLLPPPVIFTAVGGLADNPLVGFFLRRIGAHLVDRGNRRRGVEDGRMLTDVVRSGHIVAFFPEGRRSPVPGLEPFRMGAFLVAADAAVPVVPMAVRGTRHILPVGRRAPRRARVTVTVQPPVSTSRTGWQGAVELHRATRPAILRDCGEPDLA